MEALKKHFYGLSPNGGGGGGESFRPSSLFMFRKKSFNVKICLKIGK